MKECVEGEFIYRIEDEVLTIEGIEQYAEQTDTKMLINNRIPYLLDLRVRYIDNSCHYCYNVSGLTCLGQYIKDKKLEFKMARELIKGIYEVVKNCDEYFLKEKCLQLDTRLIFWNQTEQKVYFCYFPGKERELVEQLKDLWEKLLPVADHKEKKGVELIYEIYEVIFGSGFHIEGIRECLKRYSLQENEQREEKILIEEKEGGFDELETENELCENKEKIVPSLSKKEMFPYCLRNISEYNTVPMMIHLDKEMITIGRAPDNDVVISGAQISRKHARIEQEEGVIYLTERNAVNGVFLNNRRLLKEHPVRCDKGDKISFADIEYLLCVE